MQFALNELADRLVVPADLISVHRDDPARSRSRRYQSIRYGAFLLTYGPFERFFNRLIELHGGPSQGLSLTTDKLRSTFEQRLAVPNLTNSWKARVRVAPGTHSRDMRWRWIYLNGSALRDYLLDARRLRNLLAHGADPSDAENSSMTLYVRRAGGGHSVTLMWAEGFLQAAQDLASITARRLAGDDIALPDWPQPVRSGVSARLPEAPYQ
ncbi:hypothetical protein Daura_31790 [Dactylosporangium aurantiacum]|uniref:RiboL-PSP-HEPN domain-containing protein n=1 Tax=Dactylosporangium aurantiacum TaxID=35754 RepID=A0A9Q9MCU0_9ACTN|nr:hypothetical protein [Dactylosporangium aurantiacum]MDG6109519.1 hypothetical protein [Dactylosporangium aurantiacum]UWZ51324.1 hypothetical protein Daura_31790 [Dactylosporangium aurantiacum]